MAKKKKQKRNAANTTELWKEVLDALEDQRNMAVDIADLLASGERPVARTIEAYKRLRYTAEQADKAYRKELQKQLLDELEELQD